MTLTETFCRVLNSCSLPLHTLICIYEQLFYYFAPRLFFLNRQCAVETLRIIIKHIIYVSLCLSVYAHDFIVLECCSYFFFMQPLFVRPSPESSRQQSGPITLATTTRDGPAWRGLPGFSTTLVRLALHISLSSSPSLRTELICLALHISLSHYCVRTELVCLALYIALSCHCLRTELVHLALHIFSSSPSLRTELVRLALHISLSCYCLRTELVHLAL